MFFVKLAVKHGHGEQFFFGEFTVRAEHVLTLRDKQYQCEVHVDNRVIFQQCL